MTEALFVAGLFANIVKGGDLFLSERQKKTIDDAMATLTLRLDYLRPIRWFGALSLPRQSLLWSVFSAFFVWFSLLALPVSITWLGVALAVLFDLVTMTVRNLKLGVAGIDALLVSGLVLSVFGTWRFAPPLVQRMVGTGRFWPFLGRLIVVYGASVVLMGLLWGLSSFADDYRVVWFAVLIIWPLSLPVATLNAAGLLLITLAMVLWILEEPRKRGQPLKCDKDEKI